MSRTSLINNKVIRDTIIKYISNGNYIKTACLAAGVGETTFYEWVHKAESGNGENKIYREFWEALKKARQENISRHILNIQEASTKNNQWMASAWLLERMNPAEYGKRLELEVGPSKVLIALQEQARKAIGTVELLTTGTDNDGV